MDLDSLLGHPGSGGGEVGWAGPLDPEACRRLACDGAVTRVLVSRQPGQHHHGHDPSEQPAPTQDPSTNTPPVAMILSPNPGVAERLRAATALLPPTLGGAPTQPLEVGRATRVIQPAQRTALAVRDGGCVFPHCQRPLAWCDAHHLRHWLHGGPTDLANLALLCRAHHRAVHEGGWQLQPRTRRPLHRHPTASATSHRPATSQRRLTRPAGRGTPHAGTTGTARTPEPGK